MPLLRTEPKVDVGARHFRQHDALALLDVFPGDDAGIQLGKAALGGLRREIGQRYLESFEDIHFGLWIVRRMLASIPGRRSGAGPLQPGHDLDGSARRIDHRADLP